MAGLDNDGIRQVREHLGVPTTTAEAEHLRRLTGGNPFFVIESVAFTDPTESLGVRRAVDRRVDALGDTERHVLTVASLIGREAPDALVEAVVGAGADQAFAAIEAAGLMRGERAGTCSCTTWSARPCATRPPPEERRALYAAIVHAAETPEPAASAPAGAARLAGHPGRARHPARRAVALLEAAATTHPPGSPTRRRDGTSEGRRPHRRPRRARPADARERARLPARR